MWIYTRVPISCSKEPIYKPINNIIYIYKLSKPLGNTSIRVHLSITSHINHHMQSICNEICIFYSIQNHRHIGTSSIKVHINHYMHYSCNDIYICSVPFKHINILIHHKSCHISSSRYACFSFVFVTSWCRGVRNPTVFHFIVLRVTQPKGLVSWCRGVQRRTVFHFIVPRGTQPKGLVSWCREVRSPRVLFHGVEGYPAQRSWVLRFVPCTFLCFRGR
jgi:hypothetical protein